MRKPVTLEVPFQYALAHRNKHIGGYSCIHHVFAAHPIPELLHLGYPLEAGVRLCAGPFVQGNTARVLLALYTTGEITLHVTVSDLVIGNRQSVLNLRLEPLCFIIEEVR